MPRIESALRRRRTAVLVGFDASAWVAAYALFALVRFSFHSERVDWSWVGIFAVASAALHVLLGRVVRLHHGRAALASFSEMVTLGLVASSAGLFLAVLNLAGFVLPRSLPFGATFAALVIMAWGRASWRWLREREAQVAFLRAGGGTPTLIIGAGDGGRELVDSMLRDPDRTWLPVALLDDDPHKRHRRIRNVPVLGTTDQIVRAVRETGASTAIIAIPSARPHQFRKIHLACEEAGVDVKVLPSSTELLRDHVGIRDIRDINLADVLGRHQLDTDVASIADYVGGRRVLVTGAGGSIGSELCRQLRRFDPAELIMLDRDESALHAVQLSLRGRALLDTTDVVLCDIRDLQAVKRVFVERRPEVVFHAAALKHLPMLEQYPAEAVKTNVLGTWNVLQAAEMVDVDKFVNISTDKAANPTSVLGWTKRLSERITAAHASSSPGTYLSVRFGNVLGSRGSVLMSFASQIAEGGPVTVTDAEVTRFFMTIEEACQLVIQAAAIGRAGEALVLDMGEPVRILDVARRLIDQSGRRIDIEFTGLRPGEKLHEELFGDGEPENVRPAHALVSHVPVPAIGPEDILALPLRGASEDLVAALNVLCQGRSDSLDDVMDVDSADRLEAAALRR